jgi:hypothetical protein
MKEDFEEWAKGKVALDHYNTDYANLEAQIAWKAWQRAWNIAIRAQRQRDEEEINALRHKINAAMAVLGASIK